ncbi:OmpA family protein [Algivirga pacifica]|uniref:OmpA-like domain-containing protein n=1 Tax=Algivirga pacifica TaxID=1162670 RepID=A0ABP9DB77_9BACT
MRIYIKANFLPLLLIIYLFPAITRAQDAPLSKEVQEALEAKNYTQALELLEKSLTQDESSFLLQYYYAETLLGQAQSTLKESLPQRYYLDIHPILSLLYQAQKHSELSIKYFQEATPDSRSKTLEKTGISDRSILYQLPYIIEKEAFETLHQVPYRFNTKTLGKTGYYNLTQDADTLATLRESFIKACRLFQNNFSSSPYKLKMKQMAQEMLGEYTQLRSIRQYGDRSGKMYERYCEEVLYFFEEKDLKNLFKDYYSQAFYFDSPRKDLTYQKLQELGNKYGLSVLELLCQLNIHDRGCYNENLSLYEEFITTMAPSDMAFVALRKLAAHHIAKADYTKAIEIYNNYKELFPTQRTLFDQTITLLGSTSTKRELINIGTKVNSPLKDFEPIASMDGKSLYFARLSPDTGEDVFYSEKNSKGQWTVAKKLSDRVNTASHEIPTGISADNRKLFLYGNYNQSSRFQYIRQSGVPLGKGDFYYTEVDSSGQWGKVYPFPYPVNTPHYEAGLFMTADKQAVLFCSDRPEDNPSYNPNYAQSLYFHGAGEFNTDLYVSVKNEEGDWETPINLGEIINTPFAEKKPYLHPDMKTLYFCSDGHYGLGGYDIYMSKRLDMDSWTSWSEPVNLGLSINTIGDDAIYFTMDGQQAFVVSDRKEDGWGSEDIYQINIPKEVRPEPVVLVQGRVVTHDGSGLQTTLRFDHDQDSLEKHIIYTDSDGSFSIPLEPKQRYTYYAEDKDFFGSSVKIYTDTKDNPITVNKMELTSLKKEDAPPLVLKTLHFHSNSDIIERSSYEDLNRLLTYLIKYPNIKLRIEGHTDNIDTAKFNMDLSQRRAIAVKRYLSKRGCDPSRLEVAGFGESRPIASNEDAAGRALNRRVAFVVTSTMP